MKYEVSGNINPSQSVRVARLHLVGMTVCRQILTFSKNYYKSNKYISFQQSKLFSLNCVKSMPSLQEVVIELNKFADESYAEKWDNVGLLIEPHTPR